MDRVCRLAKCYRHFVILLLVMMQVSNVSGATYSEGTSRLHRGLFSGYNSDVIPLESRDSPVVLKVFPTIVKLNSAAESSTSMESTISITMNWNDHRLRWDPAMFDNISEIFVPLKNLWRPDIGVHDMGQGQNEKLFDDLDIAIVTHEGFVTYAKIAHVILLCSNNNFKFPFDESKCYVTIGSWLYSARHLSMEFWHTNGSATKLDVKADNLGSDVTSRTPGQWRLVGEKAWGFMRNMRHACCPDDPNILLEITLQLERNPGWMAAVLLLTIIVSALLLPLQFCISPRSDTRLIHGFAVLLMSFGSAAFITSVFPTTQSRIPKIGISILGIITAATVALFLSIIVTVFSQRDRVGLSPPTWLVQVLKPFQQLLCVDSNTKPPVDRHQPSRIYKPPGGFHGDFYRAEEIPLQESNNISADMGCKESKIPDTSKHADELELLYTNTNSVFEQLSALLDLLGKERHATSDWDAVLTLLDRMFLLGFTFLSAIFVIVLIT